MKPHAAGRLLLVVGTVLLLAATPAGAQHDAAGGPEPIPLVAVGYDDGATLEDLLAAGLDVIDVDTVNREVFVLAHPFEQAYIEAADLAYEVIHENLNVFPETFDPGFGTLSQHEGRTNYRFLPDYYDELETIAAQFPDLTRLEQVGSSIEGRAIMALEISSAPGVADGRPEHLHMALHHAREWPSSEQALDLAWYLVDNYGDDERVTAIVDGIRVYVIPMVNPDGFNWSRTVQPLWRKNRNPAGAVDPNRNYDYNWGGTGSSGNPNSQTYRGVAPFSEPETQAVRDFFADKHLVTTITGHTHGGWWLFPWGHKSAPPPDEELSDLAQASVQWSGYTAGPTNTTLYATSGDTTDWAYGTYRSLAFTPEYGTTGSFHPPYMGTPFPHVIAGGVEREGRYITGSLAVTGQSARLVDCGLALSPDDCPDDTEGAIALIERGDETFANKGLNAASRGAVGAVIYNNTGGHINGTLGGNPVPVPVLGIPRADGLALLADMAGGEVEATLDVRGAHSYARVWEQQLPAFLLNIEAAAEHAARIGGTVSDARTGDDVTAHLDLSLDRQAFTAAGQVTTYAHETSITATGAFDWAVLPSAQPELGTPPYTLAASATNYYPQEHEVELAGFRDEAELELALQPLAQVQEPHQLERLPVNATLPLRFFTFTPSGEAEFVQDVTVTLLDGDDVLAHYTEGAGASSVRRTDQPGRYIVNVNTSALGLGAGTYDLAVDFVHGGESYRYTVALTVAGS